MLFCEFIEKLRSKDLEQAEKISLIKKECTENLWFREVLRMTYDPFFQYYIKTKFPRLDPNNLQDIETISFFEESTWNDIVYPLLISLNKRELNTEEYTRKIKDILSMFSNDDQNIIECIITKDLRIGFAAKSINSALGVELIPVSDCQLCKAWDEGMIVKNVDGFWASRKLNGLRGRYKERGNEFTFLTREDYQLIGFDAITDELKVLQKKYNLSLVDGEVFNFNLPFQTIMSVARGQKTFDPKQKELLQFNIFCVLKKDKKWKDTKEMIDFIQQMLKETPCKYIVPLQYEWVNNDRDSIVELCRKYTNEGYEGVVLRDPKVYWEPGKRNNHLLKFKLFYETDLIVKEVLYGKAGKKFENSIAALLCEGVVRAKKRSSINSSLTGFIPVAANENNEDNDYVDLKVRVEASCSSCTDEEREVLTASKDSIVGQTVEVKFQTFTDKPDEDDYYSLQFPVFSKFKSLR